eukprot:IDg22692t1
MALTTFKHYMQKLTKHVEMKISDLLLNNIALVFDGWASGSTHYVAVYASFASSVTRGYSLRLLAISSFEDESSLGAEEHVKFLHYILGMYNKTVNNVVCLIGCASHRFNLAVNGILKDHEDFLSTINALMGKLKGLLLGAKLRDLTQLVPRSRNITR